MITDARDVPPIQFEDVPDKIRAIYAEPIQRWWNDGRQGETKKLNIMLPWPWPPMVTLVREEVYLRSTAALAFNERGPHVGMMIRPASDLDKMALSNYAASLP